MAPDEYEGETQDPRCSEEGCNGIGSHRCVVRALREENVRLTRERDEAVIHLGQYGRDVVRENAALRAKLAREIDAANQRAAAQGEAHAALLDKLDASFDAMVKRDSQYADLEAKVARVVAILEIPGASGWRNNPQQRIEAALAAAKGE